MRWRGYNLTKLASDRLEAEVQIVRALHCDPVTLGCGGVVLIPRFLGTSGIGHRKPRAYLTVGSVSEPTSSVEPVEVYGLTGEYEDPSFVGFRFLEEGLYLLNTGATGLGYIPELGVSEPTTLTYCRVIVGAEGWRQLVQDFCAKRVRFSTLKRASASR